MIGRKRDKWDQPMPVFDDEVWTAPSRKGRWWKSSPVYRHILKGNLLIGLIGTCLVAVQVLSGAPESVRGSAKGWLFVACVALYPALCALLLWGTTSTSSSQE